MTRIADAVKLGVIYTIIASSALVFPLALGNVKICNPQNQVCDTYTKAEYRNLKKGLADRISIDDPLTLDEYQKLLGILNQELKGGKKLGAVHSQSELKQKLTNILYE